MLDDFREWLSDNLRYLLLGLAVVLLLIIGFFAVKLVRGLGDGNKKEPEAVTEQSSTEQETDDNITLEKNVPAILDVMTRYYTARAEKDIDTVRSINPGLSAEEEASLNNSNPIERYDNIVVYSKEGLTEGSYIVYVYFDAKIVGIETVAPTLTDHYLETDEEGNLVMASMTSTQELADFVETMRATDAVQALIRDVNQKLAAASASDEDLEAYIVALQNSSSTESGDGDDSGEDDGDDDSADNPDSPAVNSTATATTDIIVRSEASTSGIQYGSLSAGMSATVLENLDSGWSKIQYTSNGTTIEGYVMTQYLAAAD